MKVSVVIPVYNVECYLERCVQSVLRQTYRDFEIILVDDGSTDGSGSLCDQLAQQDSRIRVVHQQNQGLSAARNQGVRCANGEYIAFLDSDDEWLLEDGLETILVEDSPDLIVFKRVDIWNRNHRISSADYDLESISRLPDPQAVFAHLVSTQQLQIGACYQLVRRQVIVSHDIFFPIGMISEDVFWNMHLWQHLSSVRFTNVNLYGYHHRNDSITTTVSIRVYQSYDQIFTYWKSQCMSGCTNAEMILAYMANMWVSRGYDYLRLPDAEKPKALVILQKHADILKYGISPKSRRTRWLVQLLGLRLAVGMLGQYWRLRCLVKLI